MSAAAGATAPRRPAKRAGAAETLPTRAVLLGAEDRLLKLPEVIQIAKIGKTMIYKLMRDGRFPRACKPVGSSSSRWSEQEVSAWAMKQLASRANEKCRHGS
ncbi:AlpA family phage regulatory protein [Sphingomonas nostoxanthinifaciens]|nr:AlpA family phage regulatory protein [Sphingomonas nostoxanthinifaciens]